MRVHGVMEGDGKRDALGESSVLRYLNSILDSLCQQAEAVYVMIHEGKHNKQVHLTESATDTKASHKHRNLYTLVPRQEHPAPD